MSYALRHVTIDLRPLPSRLEKRQDNAGKVGKRRAIASLDSSNRRDAGQQISIIDIWGRKPVLLIAIAVFFIGSALSATAVGMAMLIAGRAVQGRGGGIGESVDYCDCRFVFMRYALVWMFMMD